MVDLEAVDAPAETSAMDGGIKLCRLCLRHEKSFTNIFEEEPSPAEETSPTTDAAPKKMPIVERLFDLLDVKFEHSPLLPNSICQRCFAMVEAFTDFRENVQRCETELQRWLERNNKVEANDNERRPGLNGNPGTFDPEDDCIITEVDPNQEYESSEDDFSMESDSEVEEQSAPSSHALQVAINPESKLSQQQTNEFGDSLGAAVPLAAGELHSADNSLTAHDSTSSFTSMQAGDAFIGGEIIIRNTYLCQYCDMAFTTQADCQEHESKHDSAAPYVCSFCSQRTSSRQNLIYHIKKLHDPERPYVCAFCKKGFCRRSDLKKHTIVHTGVRPYSCPVCAKSFSRNTNLTKHIRIHSSVKPHVCTRCPRSFSSAPELMRHIRSHTNSKPFQCSRCPSTFARKDKLHIHEQTHYRRDSEFLLNQSNGALPSGGIKNEEPSGVVGQTENIVVALNPYGEVETTQPHANMSSPQDQYRQHNILAAQLQQRPLMPKPPPHKPSHPRIFNCTICQKTFTRERDLQRHQALHLDTLFTCKQCGIGFNRREKLARHELEYHAPQYPCDICRLQFCKREEYERHMKMHELQQTAAMATQAAITAAAGVAVVPPINILGLAGGPNTAGAMNLVTTAAGIIPPPPPAPPAATDMSFPQHRPSAADMSFYSQLVPTMNLGFYSETRPEDRNGI